MVADNEYISVEGAAELLGLGKRHTFRYAEGNNPRIRTKTVGNRKLFHRGDVEALAAERQAMNRTSHAKPSKTELVPMGEVLEHIRQLEAQLTHAVHEAGRLQGILEHQQKLLTDAEAARQRLADLETERDELRSERDKLQEELQRLQDLPWWKRLFHRV